MKAKPDAIKTISNVDFEEFNWAKARVAVDDVGDQALKRAAELHGFGRGKGDSVGVDV